MTTRAPNMHPARQLVSVALTLPPISVTQPDGTERATPTMTVTMHIDPGEQGTHAVDALTTCAALLHELAEAHLTDPAALRVLLKAFGHRG